MNSNISEFSKYGVEDMFSIHYIDQCFYTVNNFFWSHKMNIVYFHFFFPDTVFFLII